MIHERRIVEAFTSNGITNVLMIDDAFDPPALNTERQASLLEFLESDGWDSVKKELNIPDDLVDAAIAALQENETDNDDLEELDQLLYRKFCLDRSDTVDPDGHYKTVRGASLEVLDPLRALLEKCSDALKVTIAGVNIGFDKYTEIQPEVVFLDFYLGDDVAVDGDGTDTAKTKARGKSIELLKQIIDFKDASTPSIVLMSSADVETKVNAFRQAAKGGERDLLSLRFRFLRKTGLKLKAKDEITIDNHACDALLDTSQGYEFGKVTQDAIMEWKRGAVAALDALMDEIGTLQPKDFAYLLRFRLVEEGTKISDYMEWLFSESLKGLVDEKTNWNHQAFEQLDKEDLGKGIEGAFEGPSSAIARIFHRIRFVEGKDRARDHYALGDVFMSAHGKKVRVVITPDCDLVRRKGKLKVDSLLTMGGELRTFDQDNASADGFIFRNGKPYSLKWNPKDIQSHPIHASSRPAYKDPMADINLDYAGTLRPIYAQETQQLALSELSRVGVAVSPAMGVDAKIAVWIRKKKGKGSDFAQIKLTSPAIATIMLGRGSVEEGHLVLLRRHFVHELVDYLADEDLKEYEQEDSKKVSDFLKEQNQQKLLRGFLTAGSKTKSQGPLGTTFRLNTAPDKSANGTWLQFLLELSNEGIEELSAIDPLAAVSAVGEHGV